MDVLQNSHRFRVLWHGRTELTQVPGGYKKCCTRTPGIVAQYRTHRSSGYGYECPTELTEVPGTGMTVLQNFKKFRAGMKMLYPYPGCCGMVVQILQKFRVRVLMYTTNRSSLCRYGCCSELTEVPRTSNTRVNTCLLYTSDAADE